MTFQQTGVMDMKVFNDMQTGKPFATYRKTTLGKVFVNVLSSFPPYAKEGLMLVGEPNSETAKVNLWSEMEEAFFKRVNSRALETGVVIKVKVEEVAVDAPKTIEQFSDEELVKVLSQHYTKLQETVSGIKSEAVLQRLLQLAKDNDKSTKTVEALVAKLSALQAGK
jgi:hypothetical protein